MVEYLISIYFVGFMILILQQKRRIKLMKAYQINNWMILYKRGDAFNGGIELEMASKIDSKTLPILVGLAGSV